MGGRFVSWRSNRPSAPRARTKSPPTSRSRAADAKPRGKRSENRQIRIRRQLFSSADHNMFDANNQPLLRDGGRGRLDRRERVGQEHDAEPHRAGVRRCSTRTANGKITPGGPSRTSRVDPARITGFDLACYSVAVNPEDGSLCAPASAAAKRLIASGARSNPPMTARPSSSSRRRISRSRSSDRAAFEADHKVWSGRTGRSRGHFSSFDRTLCKTTSESQQGQARLS